jgi:hypothetical protein
MSTDNSLSTSITREMLLLGHVYGTHHMSSNDEPLIGFKKVECVVKYQYQNNTNNDTANKSYLSKFTSFVSDLFKNSEDIQRHEKCIAKVEMSPGSTIIRPYSKDPYSDTKFVSDKLRTNSYKILNINPVSELDKSYVRKVVSASSIHDPKYGYKENTKYHVELNKREDVECASGLYFFLNEHSAKYYFT